VFAEFLGDTAGLPDVPTHQEISAEVAELLRHWRDEPLASARAEYQALQLVEEILIEEISPAEGGHGAESAVMIALALVQRVKYETNDRINTELIAEERRGAK
jgi:hypothetical protein